MGKTGTETITVRGLEIETKRRLRILAARHGRSMEHEVRDILRKAVDQPPAESEFGLGTAIRQRFAKVGYVDLEPLPRDDVREPPDFSGPEFDPK